MLELLLVSLVGYILCNTQLNGVLLYFLFHSLLEVELAYHSNYKGEDCFSKNMILIFWRQIYFLSITRQYKQIAEKMNLGMDNLLIHRLSLQEVQTSIKARYCIEYSSDFFQLYLRMITHSSLRSKQEEVLCCRK